MYYIGPPTKPGRYMCNLGLSSCYWFLGEIENMDKNMIFGNKYHIKDIHGYFEMSDLSASITRRLCISEITRIWIFEHTVCFQKALYQLDSVRKLITDTGHIDLLSFLPEYSKLNMLLEDTIVKKDLQLRVAGIDDPEIDMSIFRLLVIDDVIEGKIYTQKGLYIDEIELRPLGPIQSLYDWVTEKLDDTTPRDIAIYHEVYLNDNWVIYPGVELLRENWDYF